MKEKSVERIVFEEGFYVSTSCGVSMKPFLRDRKDTVVISSVEGKLKKYDVVLYRRKDEYVLHRIIKVLPDSYVICGDNLYRKEYNVTDEMISGVLVGFFKGDRYIDCEKDKRYLMYVYVWRFLYPIRVVIMLAKRVMRKIKRCF